MEMHKKRYSVENINKIVNETTLKITEQYYDKMDMRDIGVMNFYVWCLMENFKATIDEKDLQR
jgi:hypothetical protein